jgi:choline-phosphate cytidylyltransferase
MENKELRIYCSGVFDLFHIGHMKLFEKIYYYCKENFNINFKIIVGIHSDYACESYKRKPIINEKVRYETIKYCKYVDEIIEDAPLETTVEFIKNHNIDYVAIGEEYKDNLEKNIFFYGGALELNKYFYISRYDLISTSDIIKLCKNY